MLRYLGNLTRYLFLSTALSISCGGSGGDSPKPNRQPEFGNLPAVQINENELYTLDIPVSDPDGDAVYLSKKGPSGISFSGKQLRWTPSDDQVGLYNITVGASDGRGGSAEKSFDIEVLDDFSDDPVISAIPDIEKIEGKNFSYQVKASDPDTGHSSTLKYMLGSQTDQTAVSSGLSINQSTGLLEWNNLPLGKYKIEIEVEDVTGRKASKPFDLTVIEPRYILSGKVVDIDGNPMPNVSVSLKGRSPGSVVTNANGEYEIRSLLRGDYDVTIDDLLNTVYDRKDFKLSISGDLSQDLLDISMRPVVSQDPDYWDGGGNSDFLAMLKDVTGTKKDPNDPTPKPLKRWDSLPVKVYPNESGHPESAESMDFGLDADGNGRHDYVDIVEEAMVLLETMTGIDLFETSQTPVGWDDTALSLLPNNQSPEEGIHFRYPVLLSPVGDSSSVNPIGPYSEIEIRSGVDPIRFKQLVFRELMTVLGMKHTKGDPYILIDEQGSYGALDSTITKPHDDETEVLKTMYRLPNGTDMEGFEGR